VTRGSVSERIEALQACPPGDDDGSPPAVSLLREPERLERELLAVLVHPEAAELPALAWDDVGREVYLERARALCGRHGDLLGEATVADLGDRARALGPIAGQLQQREPELPPEAAGDFAVTLLAEALLVALAEAGWAVEAGLAEPVTAWRDGERLDPYEIVATLREDAVAAAGWRDRATALGIGELELNPADEAESPNEAESPDGAGSSDGTGSSAKPSTSRAA
jgi:hypothetical protein